MTGTLLFIGILVAIALGTFCSMMFLAIRRIEKMPHGKEDVKERFLEQTPHATDKEFEQMWVWGKKLWLAGSIFFALLGIGLLVYGIVCL